jgi:hypothetical protein
VEKNLKIFEDIDKGNDFQNRTPIVHEIRAGIDKWISIK